MADIIEEFLVNVPAFHYNKDAIGHTNFRDLIKHVQKLTAAHNKLVDLVRTLHSNLGAEKPLLHPTEHLSFLYQFQFVCRCVAPIPSKKMLLSHPFCGTCNRIIQEKGD